MTKTYNDLKKDLAAKFPECYSWSIRSKKNGGFRYAHRAKPGFDRSSEIHDFVEVWIDENGEPVSPRKSRISTAMKFDAGKTVIVHGREK
jgi:hypothetical protein